MSFKFYYRLNSLKLLFLFLDFLIFYFVNSIAIDVVFCFVHFILFYIVVITGYYCHYLFSIPNFGVIVTILTDLRNFGIGLKLIIILAANTVPPNTIDPISN